MSRALLPVLVLLVGCKTGKIELDGDGSGGGDTGSGTDGGGTDGGGTDGGTDGGGTDGGGTDGGGTDGGGTDGGGTDSGSTDGGSTDGGTDSGGGDGGGGGGHPYAGDWSGDLALHAFDDWSDYPIADCEVFLQVLEESDAFGEATCGPPDGGWGIAALGGWGGWTMPVMGQLNRGGQLDAMLEFDWGFGDPVPIELRGRVEGDTLPVEGSGEFRGGGGPGGGYSAEVQAEGTLRKD